MNHRIINLEGLLYILAFGIAIYLRVYRLGNFPLGENEAGLALKAFDNVSNAASQGGFQNGYILFTSVLFSLFGATNFLARLIPALTGSLLVLSPLQYKGIIGTLPALILAFGFALDPSLIALSRNAGTGSLALTFLILFFGFLLNRKYSAAGISLGVAFLGGEDFWYGIVILLISWGLLAVHALPSESHGSKKHDFLVHLFRKDFLIGFFSALVLLGSLFFTRPEGLGGVLSGLSLYLGGWLVPIPNTSVGQMIISLISYELLPLFFGLVGLFRVFTKLSGRIRIVLVLLLAGVLISLLYPAREGIHLTWSVVPLWVLASYGLEMSFILLSKQNRVVHIFTVLISVLFFFMALNLIGLSSQDPTSSDFQIRLAIIGGAAIVLGLMLTLLVWGWSPGLGLSSFLSALMILLALYNISAGWRSARLGSNPYAELWFHKSSLLDADLFLETVHQISAFNTGDSFESNIAVMEPVPGPVKWVLRNQFGAEYLSVIESSTAPDMVITQDANLPQLAASYTGQDFYFVAPPNLSFTQPITWMKWIIYRKIEQENSPFFLWVRSDIFPGGVTEIDG